LRNRKRRASCQESHFESIMESSLGISNSVSCTLRGTLFSKCTSTAALEHNLNVPYDWWSTVSWHRTSDIGHRTYCASLLSPPPSLSCCIANTVKHVLSRRLSILSASQLWNNNAHLVHQAAELCTRRRSHLTHATMARLIRATDDGGIRRSLV
jgi:hypothetical protein